MSSSIVTGPRYGCVGLVLWESRLTLRANYLRGPRVNKLSYYRLNGVCSVRRWTYEFFTPSRPPTRTAAGFSYVQLTHIFFHNVCGCADAIDCTGTATQDFGHVSICDLSPNFSLGCRPGVIGTDLHKFPAKLTPVFHAPPLPGNSNTSGVPARLQPHTVHS
ncbi:hypothetical protein CBL_10407 [Carabus blaptoides fortunei]